MTQKKGSTRVPASVALMVTAPRVTFTGITAIVAADLGYAIAQLRADFPDARRHEFAHARFLIVWLARRLTSLSYPQIAERLGYTDHTSCINAKNRVDAWIVNDPRVGWRLEALVARCEGKALERAA